MDYIFSDLDWGMVIAYIFTISLGVTIVLGVLSSYLDRIVEKRQDKIRRRMRYLSHLSKLTYDEQVEIIGNYNLADTAGGVSLHKVLITFTNKRGVEYENVECGYLFTNDHTEDVFDKPFNEYLIKTLLGSAYNVREVQFSLAKLTNSEFHQIRRDVHMVKSDQLREANVSKMRTIADRSVTGARPELSVLSELRQNNLKPISQA